MNPVRSGVSLSVSFLQCWGGEEGDRPKVVIFLHLIFLLHLCSFPSSIYTAPPPASFLPTITLHFLCCWQPQSQPTSLPEVVQWWEQIKKEEQNQNQDVHLGGRRHREAGVFMEPCMEGPAACVAQKHFKLTTEEHSVD